MNKIQVFPREVKGTPELRPRSEGLKHGVEYIRRLRADVERSWPLFHRAMTDAGLVRSVSAVAAALWDIASESRPATHPRHVGAGRWGILEPKILAELRRGLPIKLAAARVGVPYSSVMNRAQADPDFAARMDVARLNGVAKIHGHVIERAEGGSDAAAFRLLEWSGEPEYTSKIRIQEPDEAEVLRSRAWQRIEVRLAGLLCAECRERVIAGMGER